MAKCKITRKWIEQNYTCVSVGYCGLQYLLSFQSPQYYTCGVYGWNCDVYTFGNYAITTGYRGMISHIDGLGYERTRDYELKALNIRNNWNISVEEQRRHINSLLAEYLKEVFKTDIKVY